MHSHRRFTFHGEEDSFCRHPSLVDGDALVPAGLIGAHGGHLERKVGQHMHPGVQTGVVAGPQPGEVEVNGADDVAREDSAGAGGHRDVTADCDGRRRLCGEEGRLNHHCHNGSKPLKQHKVRITALHALFQKNKNKSQKSCVGPLLASHRSDILTKKTFLEKLRI